MTIKTVLIIGGTSGIGLGVATLLKEKGIQVYTVGRRQMLADNPLLSFIQADISTDQAIAILADGLKDVTLDAIVYSAATEAPLKSFELIESAEFDRAIATNLKAPFMLTNALLGRLSKNARLLFFTSRLAHRPEAGSLLYCMTKAALETLSAGLNAELGDRLIASAITPGIVDTEMQQRLRNADPAIFSKAMEYIEMQPQLQNIETASAKIVAHLCDTSNDEFRSHDST